MSFGGAKQLLDWIGLLSLVLVLRRLGKMEATVRRQCLLGLVAGAALALILLPAIHKRPRRTVYAESGLSVLPRGDSMHQKIQDAVLHLEHGTTSVGEILELTLLLGECLQHHSTVGEGAEATLVWQNAFFGSVKIHPPSSDGYRTWDFELSVAPPVHYEEMADETTLSIGYRGIDGMITKVTAVSDTHIHRTKDQVDMLRIPYVVGGSLMASGKSSSWQQETLAFDDSSGKDVWISRLADAVRKADGIESEESGLLVAALLFSL